MFAQAAWHVDGPDGDEVARTHPCEATAADIEKATDVERVLFHYIRIAAAEIHKVEAEGRELSQHRRAAMRWVDHLEGIVARGEHPVLKKDWLQDDRKTALKIMRKYEGTNDPDMAMAQTVGENLPAVIQNDGNIFEFMVADGALDRMVEFGIGQTTTNVWVSSMVKQVANRFPQMNIIEIGAGTGGTTKGIVAALDKAFASYTFTDISSGFFPAAQQTFSHYEDRMEYKTLDIVATPASQGFKTGHYDMVVAAAVLHATPDLRETLVNARSLLKPGGWLCLMEIVDHTAIRYGAYYFGVSGWWVGADTGRPWSPCITIPEWDVLLRETGFAGVGASVPIKNGLVTPGTCFMAQAVDDDFRLLRQPLQVASPNKLEKLEGRTLVMLNSAGHNAARLADPVQKLMMSRYDEILRFDSLEQLLDADLPSGCTTLGLGDLDEPLFKTLSSSRWEGFKKITACSSTVLWVTTGASSGVEPYSAMILGCFRSIQYEHSQCQFQVLDVSLPDASAAPGLVDCVSEALLRLELLARWKTEAADGKSSSDKAAGGVLKGMLWTVEPQLAWDGHHTKVLRVKPHEGMNDRYNSSHRRILKATEPEFEPTSKDESQPRPVVLNMDWEQPGPGWKVSLDRSPRYAQPLGEDLDLPVLEADASVLPAIGVTIGGIRHRLFLVLGECHASQQRYLFFSTKQASSYSGVKSSHAIPVSPETTNSVLYLSYAVAHLLCEQLASMCLDQAPPGLTLVIHEPDPVIAAVFLRRLRRQGSDVRVVYTTCNPAHGAKRNWVLLHPHSPKRLLRARLPRRGPVTFVDMSAKDDAKLLAARIESVLPPSSIRFGANDLLSQEPSAGLPSPKSKIDDGTDDDLKKLLLDADKFAMALLNDITEGTPLPVSSIAEVSAEPERFTSIPNLRAISWKDACSAPVEVQPAEKRRDIFRDDVTYWLVGLAGDMGRSLCDWMTELGARHVVVSSRNPSLPPEWLEEHRSEGHHIYTVRCDVTSMEDVLRAKAEIEGLPGCPPIRGVANGAMVLRDRPMMDTSFDTLQQILRPKVEGTVNLDRAFYDADLDFFVVLSSIVADIGNFGQMGYSTANCFQKALVQQRRARGVAGSSVDIGSVVGVGYVTRETTTGELSKHTADHLRKKAYFKVISEVDLRHMFAEAVLSSRPSSRRSCEIITGLQPVTTQQSLGAMTLWARNPIFAHWIWDTSSSSSSGGQGGDDGARKDVKKMLAEAESKEEVLAVVLGTLFTSCLLAFFFFFIMAFLKHLC